MSITADKATLIITSVSRVPVVARRPRSMALVVAHRAVKENSCIPIFPFLSQPRASIFRHITELWLRITRLDRGLVGIQPSKKTCQNEQI